MRTSFRCILLGMCTSVSLTAMAQVTPDGFTNKKEATNGYTENGTLKQGKWYTILDKDSRITTDSTHAVYYTLANYIAGKPVGKVRQYDMSDKLVYENRYRDGKLTETREYHKNGKLYLEAVYGDGKKNGMEKTYYENGVLMSETPYTNGDKNGLEKNYFESGKIKSEIPYVNNKKNGVEKNYYSNGRMESEIPYNNNFKNGMEKDYSEDGELSTPMCYNHGKLQKVKPVHHKSAKGKHKARKKVVTKKK